MGKRLRSLASLLWDDGEPESLPTEWISSPSATSSSNDDAFLDRDSMACWRQRCKEEQFRNTRLQDENLKLRKIISELQLAEPPGAQHLMVTKPALARKLREDPWHWLKHLPQPVLSLPRLESEIIPDLSRTNFVNGCLGFDMSSGGVASTVLGHGELTIKSFSSKCPALHKVGITSNPVQRWLHSSYGYQQDKHVKWDGMKIIFVHSDVQAVAFLEAALIRLFHGVPGCRNVQLGGEGLKEGSNHSGPYFCYVVYKLLWPPR